MRAARSHVRSRMHDVMLRAFAIATAGAAAGRAPKSGWSARSACSCCQLFSALRCCRADLRC